MQNAGTVRAHRVPQKSFSVKIQEKSIADHLIKTLVLNYIGDMAYGASVLHVFCGNTITCSSETGSFSLSFRGHSPLNERLQLRSRTGSTLTGMVSALADEPPRNHNRRWRSRLSCWRAATVPILSF